MKLNKASLRANFIKRALNKKRVKDLKDDPFKFITTYDLIAGHRNRHISKRDCNGLRYVMNHLRYN